MAKARSSGGANEPPTGSPIEQRGGAAEGVERGGSSLRTLARMAGIIAGGSDPESMLQALRGELATAIPNDTFGVLLTDPESGGLRWFNPLGLRAFKPEVIPSGLGVASEVLASGRGELLNHARRDPRSWPPPAPDINPGPEHMMLAPLITEGKPVGVLVVGRFADPAFSGDEFETFLVIAEMTASAIRGTRMLQELRDERDVAVASVRALTRLAQSHTAIAEIQMFSVLRKAIFDEMLAIVPARKIVFLRIKEQSGTDAFTLDGAGQIVPLIDPTPISWHPVVQQAIEAAAPLIVNDLNPAMPGFGAARSLTESEHVMVVPIRRGDALRGAAILLRSGDHRFAPLDAEVARSLVLHASAKVANLELIDSTRDSERREIRSRERVEAILAATRAIVSWHDLQQVIGSVADLVQRHVSHDRFLALSFDSGGRATVRRYRRNGKNIPVDRRIETASSPLAGLLDPGAVQLQIHPGRQISELGLDDDGRVWRSRGGITMAYTIESPQRVVGAVLIERSSEASFSEEETTIFEALASVIAVAYQTASSFDEERRGRSDADLLARAGARLTALNGLDDLAGAIAELMPPAMGARAGMCAIVDEFGMVSLARGSALPPGASLADIARLVAADAAVGISALDPEQIRRTVGGALLPSDTHAWVLAYEGTNQALILTWNMFEDRLQLHDQPRLTSAMLDLASTALTRVLTREEGERRILELNAIARLNQLVASGVNAERFCEAAVTALQELIGASAAGITVEAWGGKSVSVRVGDRGTHDCTTVPKYWSVAQTEQQPFEIPGSTDDEVLLAVPIVADGTAIGVSILARTGRRFAARDRIAVERLAGQVAVGLQRIRSYELALRERARADRQSITLSRVLEATSLVLAIHDRDEVIRTAAVLAPEIAAAHRVAIYWRDSDGELRQVTLRDWPSVHAPGPGWEYRFIDDAILTGSATRRSHLGLDSRFDFSGVDAAALAEAGIHLVVTPISAEDGSVGAIAYTRLGGQEFDESELSALRIYAAQLSAVLANTRLIARNRELLMSGIRSLVSAVDAKDPYTRGHSERVSQLARLLATEMELPLPEIDTIELAGLLHDFGKIGVPDAILHKPDKLTPAERAIMMRHANLGADMLAGANSDGLAPLVPLVRHHHEWVNGGGYPDGLIGEQIPIGSAIISVADAYDTMTTDRPYRTRISHRQAMAELNRSMGRQFSAPVVEALEALSGHGHLAVADTDSPAAGEVSRVPLAAEESTPIGDAQALKLLIDMIPLTHLIAESEQFYQRVTDLVRRSLHLPTLSLHLTDEINGGLARIACSGEHCETLPKWQPLAAGIRGAAMRSRQFRVVGDVVLDPAYDPAHDPAAGSMLITPLIVDELVIGLLAVEAPKSRSIEPTHLAVLQIIAGQIASAVRLAQLHAEARAAAVTDPWTGLGNHRAFWDALDRAVTEGASFRVGMLDLEGLRRLNLEQGHHAGDAVLRRIADELRAQMDQPELAARLGGGQFGLVLQELGAERERAVLGMLEQAVQASGIALRAGFAAFPGDGQTSRELVGRAEARLATANGSEKRSTPGR